MKDSSKTVDRRFDAKKVAVSAVIVVVIALQAFTSFRGYTYVPLFIPATRTLNWDAVRYPKMWPFLTYPMYEHARHEGDTVSVYQGYAILDDSNIVEVTPEDLGLSFWKFELNFVTAIRRQECDNALQYAEVVSALHSDEVRALGLRREPWIVLRDGPVKGELMDVAQLDLEASCK